MGRCPAEPFWGEERSRPTGPVCCILPGSVLLQHRAPRDCCPSPRALAKGAEKLLAPGKVRLSFLYCDFCHCLRSLRMRFLQGKVQAPRRGGLGWVPWGGTRRCSPAAGSATSFPPALHPLPAPERLVQDLQRRCGHFYLVLTCKTKGKPLGFSGSGNRMSSSPAVGWVRCSSSRGRSFSSCTQPASGAGFKALHGATSVQQLGKPGLRAGLWLSWGPGGLKNLRCLAASRAAARGGRGLGQGRGCTGERVGAPRGSAAPRSLDRSPRGSSWPLPWERHAGARPPRPPSPFLPPSRCTTLFFVKRHSVEEMQPLFVPAI